MNLFGLLCLLVSTVLVNGSIQSNDKKIISSKQYLLTFPQILSSTGNKICLTLLDGYVPEEKDLRVISSDAENRTVFSETFRVEKGNVCFLILTKVLSFTENRHPEINLFLQNLLRKAAIPKIANIRDWSFSGWQSLITEASTDTQCFALETKDIKSNYVNLRVQLGADIDVTQIVPFQPSYGMSMIETSKPVYQPGENLRFRVIGFDGSMKPLRSDFVSIALLNPENVKIMEWPGKALEKGMNHYETELSSNNKEGIWKIVGLTKSGEAVEKLFQIAKKIQPEVVLRITQGEKSIVANEDKHRMVVCAEDKHGARLNGGLVNVKVGNRLVIRENPLEEDGCVHFHLKNETFRWDTLVGKNIQGSIEYINRETGVREYIPFYVPVVRAQVHLRVPSSALVKSYYKSSLPYFGYLIVETPNYTPLANAEVEICYKTTSKPWQFEDSQGACKTFTSSASGLIKYVIPPVDESVKQIIVEATIPGIADHKQTFVINPWVGKSSAQFIIKPILRIDSCESMPEATQFTVIMTRNGTALFDKLYLQSAGRVSSAQTKSVKLTPTPYVPESDILIGNWPESSEIYSANIYREIDAESDKHSVMNRIVMYGLDSNGNLISDSIAYLKDCLKDESLMSVNVDKNNRIAVDLKVPHNVPCSVAVGTSAERGRLTEQKINKLLEKFDDIYAKSFEWDRCSLAKLERNTNRPLIADFKNNWDTFKEMGLRAVYTKSDIFNKSCDWEVFNEATVNKSLQGLLAVQHTLPYPEHIMTSLADSANMAQLNQLENSLINDVLFWGPKENLQDFLKSLKESDLAGKSDIAVHAICMDQVRGVRSHSVVKRLNTQPIYMQHDLPIIIYQDTIQNVSLYIKRDQSSMKQSECIPVELVFERSDAYEIVSEAQPQICSCSKVTKVPLRIKALKTGPLNLKVVARFSSSLASDECTSEIESFEPQQVVIKTRVESYNPKITLRKYELACKNLPKARIGSDDDETILVAQDLANIFIKQIRDDKSIRTDILEVLARFNGLADMYIRNEKKLPRSLSRSMVGDLYKLVEELTHYKLPHGPFSFNSGNQRVPSLVATSLAYKAIAKIQDKLPQFSGADILTESFEFIAGSMMKDGCFRPKTYSNMAINLWPFDHQVSSKELTAFVAATLVEVKQTPRIVLRRCLKCIDNLETEQSDYLTRAMTAFLYAKMNRTESAKKLIRDLESELTNIQNRGERRIPERFMSEAMDNLKSNDENLRALAYLVKAKLALNQIDSIEQHIQKLIGSNLSLNDPLIVDTIAEAWRILSTGDKSVIAEIDSKRISLEKFEMKRIELPQEEKSLDFDSSKGCLILERVREIPVSKYERNYPVSSEEKREDSWELKKGETPAPYIRRGFKVLKSQRGSDESCSTRRITVCVDENLKEQRSFVVVAPNYGLDSNRLDRMIIAHETPITTYQINEYSSSFIIAPMKDACFVVPLVKQGEMVEEEVKAYIIKVNKNDKPTVGSIQIQKECSIRARRAAADQSNSSTSAAKPNRSSNSQQPNNNQGRGYDTQVDIEQQQQTYAEPAYQAPEYAPPTKGYAPAPAPPAYEPAYQAPAYEPPVKGYAPAYAPPAYEPAYQAPAYEAPAYQAPAYEAPVKGYAPPPPPPAYEPAYQAPAYEPPVKGYAPAYAPPAYEPAYQAPAYEAPVKGYAPPPPPPAYEAPAYQAPEYAPPAKGYAPPPPPPAYAPPAYEPPTYQAPAYEAPVKGYAPPPPPAYEPPAYQAPAYEPPVKGYAPPAYAPPAYAPPAYAPPTYQAPAYEPPAYQAPAYEPPAYQAPAYEPPVKGYAPPAYAPPAYAPPAYAPPAYAPPTYQAPAYEPPAYQAPAYEAPVKGYAPPPPPAYEPPAYQAPAYEAPAKGYAPPPPPAYAPPAYAPPAYEPPAYQAPAYEAPAYQAPAYEAPAKGYAPPPPPAYAPPAYAPPAYAPPAYEAPAKGYAPLPPPPAYAPPTYEAPAYRETQGRSTQLRYGNSFASNNGQQARNPSNSQRGNSQNQRGYNMNQALPQSRAARPNMWAQNSRGSRMSQRQAGYPVGSNMLRNDRFAQASELRGVVECGLQQVASSCPVCLPRLEVSMLDNMCNSTSVLSIIKPTQIKKERITCGTFTVNHSYGKNVNSTNIPEPFTVNADCVCDSLDYSYVIIVSDLMKSDETQATRTPKAFGAETTIIPASPTNVQNFATFYTTVC